MRRVPGALEILFWLTIATIIVITVLAIAGPYIQGLL